MKKVLRECPGVAAAAALEYPDPDGGHRIVGYMVPDTNGPDVTDAELLRRTAAALPGDAEPPVFVRLPALPLTADADIDLAAVPAPPSRRETLRALFAEVLNRPTVADDDSFFDMGGQSLLAIRLWGRIRSTFGRAVEMSDIFDHPTVEGLQARIHRAPAVPARPKLARRP
ncbi:phosphopantetheine-binding protein [Streptomyces sp. NBC_01306]|uniref:phosphopantetheine-binding protein n=1 Tax=Streptomyces sp. NBC_01306 TaxID=2903819 RepID=UPI00224D7CCE|nr:phosphopantetheine-binding protein [Streptomyces sp. NBC_01306]MCX4725055.1 phosphopantetheine-binding protein [Streptomyces sp. NBC_01306]